MTSPGSLKNLEFFQRQDFVYKSLINNLPAAVYLCDPDGYVIFYNNAAEKLWGRAPEVGKDIWCGSWKIYHSDGTPMSLEDCPMAETLRTKHPVVGKEIIIEQPSGQRFHILPHPCPIYDENDVMIGAINMLVDVTDQIDFQKQKERTEELSSTVETLKRSEERYHRMVAEVQDYAIILLSKEGIIENWNRGAEKIKGYMEPEILGKNFRIFYTPEDQEIGIPEKLIQQARVQGKANHEGWRVRKDGSRFWGSISITALHDSGGNVIGFSKVTRDLTEKKIAEEKLIKTSLQLDQKNKELVRMNEDLASFAYVSSHDLQEPLRKIQTFSDRIMELEFHRLSEQGKDYFKRMQAGALRMQNLIRDILAYSRTTTSEKRLERTDLNNLLEQSRTELEMVITEKGASLKSDHLPTMKVIPFQIHQMFTNLLHNSLKFCKKDVPPQIVIRTENVQSKDLPEPGALSSHGYCHISIQDNGIGFEPEYDKKIFELFQRLHGRTEYGGTGIGLAICKKIVENHNGIIKAEGFPDQGAIFHVYLPIHSDPGD